MTFEQPIWIEALSGDTDYPTGIPQSARQYRTALDAVAPQEGVVGTGSLTVTQRAAGANMSVDVSAGLCIITGDNIAGQGKYVMRNTATYNQTIPANPGGSSRTHRIIAQLYDKQSDGNGNAAPASYSWKVDIQADTGSGTPALPNNAIELAKVTVASSGVGAVTNSMLDFSGRKFAGGMVSAAAAFSFEGTTGTGQVIPINAEQLYLPNPAKTIQSGCSIADNSRAQVMALQSGVWNVAAGLRLHFDNVGERMLSIVQIRAGQIIRRRSSENRGGGNYGYSAMSVSYPFPAKYGDYFECRISQSASNPFTYVDDFALEAGFSGFCASVALSG